MKKIVVILLLPISIAAAPGPTTQYLIEEQASMLDIGMLRLAKLATEFENRVGLHWTNNGDMRFFDASVSTLYVPDDDMIHVYLSAMNSEPTDEKMAEGCRNAMIQMNIWLLKSLPDLLQHVGYDDPKQPADFYRSLENMIEIRCFFSSSRSTAEGRFWASRRLGRLGSDDMNIGKWEVRN